MDSNSVIPFPVSWCTRYKYEIGKYSTVFGTGNGWMHNNRPPNRWERQDLGRSCSCACG